MTWGNIDKDKCQQTTPVRSDGQKLTKKLTTNSLTIFSYTYSLTLKK